MYKQTQKKRELSKDFKSEKFHKNSQKYCSKSERRRKIKRRKNAVKKLFS